MILVSIRYRVRYLKVSIRYRVLVCPVCPHVLAVVDRTRMKFACQTLKQNYFREKERKGISFCGQNENKNEKGVITFEKMLYISLNFSLFLLIFPPFLGIDHLENVSMRYRYPKVLGYRVLGIGIDPALEESWLFPSEEQRQA